jgi:hypothetical protein
MKGAGMKRRAAGTAVAAFITVALAAVALAEDDLDVVRRAVAESRTSTASTRATEAAPAPTKGKPPQWLKVRVVDKSSRKARVAVNLPLGLVRAFGNDWPVDWHCRSRKSDAHDHDCSIRIGDVLRTLESGQGLVEIDDPEATVRVWVE